MYFTGCSPSIAGPRAYFMPIFSANLHWSHRNIWIDGGKNMARSLFKEKIISYEQVLIDIHSVVCLTLFISSSRKLTSWLCFLSDLYPDLDSCDDVQENIEHDNLPRVGLTQGLFRTTKYIQDKEVISLFSPNYKDSNIHHFVCLLSVNLI